MSEKIISGNFTAECERRFSGELLVGKYPGEWKLSRETWVIWQLLVADFSSVGDYSTMPFVLLFLLDKQLEIVRFSVGCSNIDLVTKSKGCRTSLTCELI